MIKSYTDRGKTWELLNSWWVLLTIIPFGMASFISFFYVGWKVKNRRWRIYGFIYLAIITAAFLTSKSGTGAALAVTLWCVTVIHAFKIRPAYLIQLDVFKANEKAIDDLKISRLRQEAEAKFNRMGNVMNKPPQPKSNENLKNTTILQEIIPPPANTTVLEIEKIDINTASEHEIARIPEIGIILAKKVIIKRNEIGGFESFEQFSQVIGLKEQTVVKIKHSITFSPLENNRNQTKSGRIIDF